MAIISHTLKRKKEVDEFFGKKQYKGEILMPSSNTENLSNLYYKHPNGKLFLADCVKLMQSMEKESVDLFFSLEKQITKAIDSQPIMPSKYELSVVLEFC